MSAPSGCASTSSGTAGISKASKTSEGISKEGKAVDDGEGLQVDALFQVFCFGTSRPCYERRTVVTLLNQHNNLTAIKLHIRKEYGVIDDARRMHWHF